LHKNKMNSNSWDQLGRCGRGRILVREAYTMTRTRNSMLSNSKTPKVQYLSTPRKLQKSLSLVKYK